MKKTRRGFFGVLAACIAGLCSRAAFGAEESIPPEDIRLSAPPIVYKGDLLDPRYLLAGMMPQARTRTGKLFIDGKDRTAEAYECYQGDDGWANLIFKRKQADGTFQTRWVNGREAVRYSVRGKVEWRQEQLGFYDRTELMELTD